MSSQTTTAAVRPLVMGIVNATPDSFSDGGRHLAPEAALAHARRLIAEGADILDVGAESTRPGAEPVPAEVEIARLVPLIAAIRAGSTIPISVDTMKPTVARAAPQRKEPGLSPRLASARNGSSPQNLYRASTNSRRPIAP